MFRGKKLKVILIVAFVVLFSAGIYTILRNDNQEDPNTSLTDDSLEAIDSALEQSNTKEQKYRLLIAKSREIRESNAKESLKLLEEALQIESTLEVGLYYEKYVLQNQLQQEDASKITIDRAIEVITNDNSDKNVYNEDWLSLFESLKGNSEDYKDVSDG